MDKNTEVIKLKFKNEGTFDLENEENLKLLKKAAEVLKNGGLCAIPTETVYGLGGDALNKEASKKIYEAKGRPSDNPLIVHISDLQELNSLVSSIPECAYKLMDNFWPGPLTIIFPKSDIVPYETTGGLDTVAIRFPSNPIAQRIISLSGVPVAAPSANTSGKPSPTKAKHVFEDLNGKIDVIVDGGECNIGVESTVLDLTSDTPYILRPGGITLEQLREYLPNVKVDKAILSKNEITKPKAPGMKYKHYAPKADVVIIECKKEVQESFKEFAEKVAENISNFALNELQNNKKIGIIATTQTAKYYMKKFRLSFDNKSTDIIRFVDNNKNVVMMIIGDRTKPETIATNLFSVLRAFDHENIDKILAEGIDKKQIGMAVRNRLDKAAGYNIIKL